MLKIIKETKTSEHQKIQPQEEHPSIVHVKPEDPTKSNKPFIIFLDTETTGLDYKKDYITQLSYITSSGFSFDSYIKLPENVEIPKEVSDLTHITTRICNTLGKSEKGCAGMLHGLLKKPNAIFVAHNAQFDAMFVKKMFERHNLDMPKCNFIDTLTIAREELPYPHKLVNCLDFFGIKNQKNSHNALDDVKALKAVFTAFVTNKINPNTYINKFGYLESYGIFGEKLNGVEYFTQI